MIIIIGLRQYTLLPLSPKIKTTRRNHSQGTRRAENSIRKYTQSGAPKPKSRPERARRGHPNQGAQHSLQLQSLLDRTPIHLFENITVFTYSENDLCTYIILLEISKVFFQSQFKPECSSLPGIRLTMSFAK